ncbi:hypothetical protein E8E13_003903 [Curvularia kusanoi]|uniref:N-acetyltransferase domain-containing protein n=1 Tax=Curvularia kusanoi TaxID=90978 RepID=A0A9P4W4P0_CURKU|nr:hypothetical protein E8E13_003903 [Curvularia kusanoi]
MTTPSIHIRLAKFPEDKSTINKLFQAYEQFVMDYASISLDFQNFAHEVASLPGKYSEENRGALYIAFLQTTSPSLDSEPAGVTHKRKPSTTLSDVDEGEPAKQPSSHTLVPIGCVGLRAFTSHSAELKRLFLDPEARGLGTGRLLVEAAVGKARELGYSEVLLDTLGSMTTARRLYARCGFEEVEAYHESLEGAVFYRLRL